MGISVNGISNAKMKSKPETRNPNLMEIEIVIGRCFFVWLFFVIFLILQIPWERRIGLVRIEQADTVVLIGLLLRGISVVIKLINKSISFGVAVANKDKMGALIIPVMRKEYNLNTPTD